jgi:hypothetical protein
MGRPSKCIYAFISIFIRARQISAFSYNTPLASPNIFAVMDTELVLKAAQLLEEILRNADATSVISKGLLKTGRINPALQPIIFTPDGSKIVYEYPASVVLGDSSADPNEVIEWVQTGLRAGESASLIRRDGELYFVLTQTESPELESLLRMVAEAHSQKVLNHYQKTGEFLE